MTRGFLGGIGRTGDRVRFGLYASRGATFDRVVRAGFGGSSAG